MPKRRQPIYARVYVEARTHEKIWPLTDAQYRLYMDSILWCRDRRTDGFVDERLLKQISPVRSPRRVAQQLVDAELFEQEQGGWFVHDYEQHQDTNQIIDQRVAAHRSGAQETNSARWNGRSTGR